jgi:hypothetical protein
VERSHQNLPFASVPPQGLGKLTSELLEVTFSSFLSLSALFLFLFFFCLFVFFSFSFTFFHHFFEEQKTRKQKDTPKNEERKRFVSFMSEKERSVYRPFQPLLLAFTYETIFKAVQGTYCHLTLRAQDPKLRDQFEAN